MQKISLSAWGFIALVLLIWQLRKLSISSIFSSAPTWGCGYAGPVGRLQYTANSFVRSYRKLVKPLLKMNKKETPIKGVFPGPVISVTHPYDKMEAAFIDVPLKHMRNFFGWFRFLQNGNPQFYILYGLIYILIAISIPFLSEVAADLIDLINRI